MIHHLGESHIASANDVDDCSEKSDDSDNELELCGDKSTPTSSSENIASEMTEVEAIARADTKMLRMWRRFVGVILVTTFCGVLTAGILFLKKAEDDTAHNNVSVLIVTGVLRGWCNVNAIQY
jgi:hypothetical protein